MATERKDRGLVAGEPDRDPEVAVDELIDIEGMTDVEIRAGVRAGDIEPEDVPADVDLEVSEAADAQALAPEPEMDEEEEDLEPITDGLDERETDPEPEPAMRPPPRQRLRVPASAKPARPARRVPKQRYFVRKIGSGRYEYHKHIFKSGSITEVQKSTSAYLCAIVDKFHRPRYFVPVSLEEYEQILADHEALRRVRAQRAQGGLQIAPGMAAGARGRSQRRSGARRIGGGRGSQIANARARAVKGDPTNPRTAAGHLESDDTGSEFV